MTDHDTTSSVEGAATLAPPSGQRRAGLLETLLSFEAVYVLFLFAGIYKGDPRLAWFPIDLTALLGALSLLIAGFVLARRDFRVQRESVALLAWFSAFTAYATISLSWSPGHTYAMQKAVYLGTVVVWAMGGSALVVAGDPVRLRRLWTMLRVFAVFVAFETTVSFLRSSPGEEIVSLGVKYLPLGRVIGIGVVLFVAHAMYGAGGRLTRIFNLGVSGLLLALLLVLGARGPFLALLVALMVPIFTESRALEGHLLALRPQAAWLSLAVAGMVAVVGYLLWANPEAVATVRRLAVLLTPSGGVSASARVYYFSSAFALWEQSPIFGNGVGSWPVLAWGLDTRGYPHNLILETLSELGLTGLLFLSAVAAIAFSSLRRTWRRAHWPPTATILAMLVVNAGLNAMVTGDIPDNRFLFAVFGLMIGWTPARTPVIEQAGATLDAT